MCFKQTDILLCSLCSLGQQLLGESAVAWELQASNVSERHILERIQGCMEAEMFLPMFRLLMSPLHSLANGAFSKYFWAQLSLPVCFAVHIRIQIHQEKPKGRS